MSGIRHDCVVLLFAVCRRIGQVTTRACAAAAPGPTTAGHAGRRFACGLNRRGVTTTLVFGLWL